MFAEVRLRTGTNLSGVTILRNASGLTFDSKNADLGAISFNLPLSDAQSLGVNANTVVEVLPNGLSVPNMWFGLDNSQGSQTVDGASLMAFTGKSIVNWLTDGIVYPSTWHLATTPSDYTITSTGSRTTTVPRFYIVVSSSATIVASTDVITTPSAHLLSIGDSVQFASLSGAAGLVANRVYYVISVPTATTFTVSASSGGSVVNITSNGTGTGLTKNVLSSDTSQTTINGHSFQNATPGFILKTLIARCVERGGMQWLDASSFTGPIATSGNPWNTTLTTTYTNGTTLLQVLQDLSDRNLIEFHMDANALKVYNIGESVAHWTPDQITFRRGKQITEQTRTLDASSTVDTVLIAGDALAIGEINDSSVTPVLGRRREKFVTQGGITDIPTLVTLMGGAELTISGHILTEDSLGIADNAILPWVNFQVGDWVWADFDGTLKNIQVQQISATVQDATNLQLGLTLGDIIASRDAKAQRLLDNITGQGGGSYGGLPNQDTGRPPSDPSTVIATPTAYRDSNGRDTCQLTVNWTAPTTKIDLTVLDNLDHYELQYRLGTSLVWTDSANIPASNDIIAGFISSLPSGQAFVCRLRAVSSDNHASNWVTSNVIASLPKVTTTPVTPSTPSAAPSLGGIVVIWDGFDNGGNPMDSTFTKTNIYISQSSTFTPSSSTLVGAFTATGGKLTFNGLTYGNIYYAKLIIVDKSGNLSAPSLVSGGVTPTQVTSADISTNSINASMIQDGVITGAKLADATVPAGKVNFTARSIGGTTTFTQSTTPTGAVTGDLWIDTGNGNVIKTYNGTSWAANQLSTTQLSGTITSSQAGFTARSIGGVTTFTQSATPTGMLTGDIWIDTGNGNTVKQYNGTAWTAYQFGDAALTGISGTKITAGTIPSTAVNFTARTIGSTTTFTQSTTPTGAITGDLWIDTGNGNVIKTYNGSSWVVNNLSTVNLTGTITAAQAGFTARTIGGTTTFVQGTTPTGAVSGDTWIDTSNGNVIKQYNGTSWGTYQLATTQLSGTVTAAQAGFTARSIGGTTTFTQSTTPTGALTGDLWIDSGNGNVIKTYNGSAWVANQLSTTQLSGTLTSAQIAATARQLGGNITYVQSATPTGMLTGDLWINTTSSANTLTQYNGTAWVAYAPSAGSLTGTVSASQVSFTARNIGGTTTFTQSTTPTGAVTGDLWINTANGNVVETYNGTSWVVNQVGPSALNVQIGGGNLLTNSNFASLTNYAVNGSSTIAVDNTAFIYPPQSLKITSTGVSQAGVSTSVSGVLAPNTTYTFSAWVKIPASGGIPYIGLGVNGSGITTPIYNPVGGYTTTAGSWVRLYLTFTTNSNASPSISLYVYDSSVSTSGLYANTGGWQLEIGNVPTAYAPKVDEILPGTVASSMVNFTARTIGGITTTTSSTAPSSPITGDLWIDTGNGNVLKQYNGSAWVANPLGDAALTSISGVKITSGTIPAAAVSFTARSIGGTTTFTQGTTPTGALAGDLWIDTSNGNVIKEYNGTAWTTYQLATAQLSGTITAAQAGFTARSIGGVTTFTQSTTPSGALTGDLWIDSGNGNVVKTYNGSAWVANQVGPSALNVTIGGGNLLTNSNFANSTAGYTSAGGATISVDTSTYYYLSQSLKVLTSGTQYPQALTTLTSLLPNTTYVFSFWAKIPTSSGVPNVSVSVQGSGVASTGLASTTITTTNVWQRQFLTFTTNATPTSGVNLIAFVTGTAPSSGLFFNTGGWQLETGNVPTSYAPKGDEILPLTVSSAMVNFSARTIGSTTTFTQSTTPTGAITGDLWIDTGNGNVIKTYSGSAWVTNQLSTTQLSGTLTAAQIAATARQLGGNITFVQSTTPTGMLTGDLWINTGSGNTLTQYNGTAWVAYAPSAGSLTGTVSASQVSFTARSIGGTTTFTQSTTPTGALAGDLWVDTGNGNVIKTYSGSAWVVNNLATTQLSGTITAAQAGFTARQIGSVTTFTQSATPTGMLTGDLWIDSGNGNVIKTYNGSAWVTNQLSTAQLTGTVSAAQIAATARQLGANTTYVSSTTPTGMITGDLWINTASGADTVEVYNGSAWVAYAPSTASLVGTISAGQVSFTARSIGGTTTFTQSTTPTGAITGDLWIDTGNGNVIKTYNGSAWVVNNLATTQLSGTITAAQAGFTARTIGSTTTFTQSATPTGMITGDLWIDSGNGNVIKTYNGSAWVVNNLATTQLSGTITAAQAGFTARAIGGTTTFTQSASPTGMLANDLWIDTGNGNALKQYNGTAWIIVQDTAIAAANTAAVNAASAASAAQTTANGKNAIYRQSTQPSGAVAGDTWFDTSNGNRASVYDGTTWNVSQFQGVAVGNLDAGSITTGSLAAGRIAATTITGTMIAGTTITAANIAANTITASQIAANTITATQIAAGTITASQLAANSVTAVQLAANSVTAEELTLGVKGQGLAQNPSFEDAASAGATIPAGWTNVVSGTGSTAVRTVDPVRAQHGTSYVALTPGAAGAGYSAYTQSDLIAISANTTYYLTTLYGASGASTNGLVLSAVWYQSDGVTTISSSYSVNNGAIAASSTNNQTSAGQVTSPSNAGYVRLRANINAPATAVTLYVDYMDIQPVAINGWLAAGSITANEIAATTITAAKIVANTITATQIAAGTITATQIAAGTITANKLSITVGGGNLLTNSNFGNGTTGYTIQNAGDTIATDATTYFYQGGVTHQSLKVTSGGATNNGVHRVITGLNPSTTYTLSAWVLNTAANGFTAPVLYVQTNVVATVASPAFAQSSNWQRQAITFTTTSTGTTVDSYLYQGVAQTSGKYFNTDAWQLEIGDTPTAYAPKVDEILPGTIVANMISANTITATQIAASTITGSNIAATTITGSNLVANTITAAQIAAGTITASQIAAGTITGTNIAATGTLTGAMIAAGTIAASNIVSSTITTTQIAASTITAANIAAATITTTQIAANTITAANIAAGTITATQIAAGTITASKLLITVGGGNLLSNSNMATTSGYGVRDAATMTVDTSAYHYPNQSMRLTSTGTTGYGLYTNVGLLVQPNTTYTFTCWILRGASGDIGTMYAGAYSSSGAVASSTNMTVTPVSGVWTRLTVTFTTAAASFLTGANVIGLYNYDSSSTTTAGNYFNSGAWQLEQGDTPTSYAPKGDEILPGTIVANMIQANAITASQIAANTITASQIAANTITASQIAAGTITATQIAAGTITGTNIAATGTITGAMIAAGTIVAGNIVSGTITGTQIAATTITAANIATNTITATQIAASTITTSQIAAGTITASNIQTGTITGTLIAGTTITAANIAAGTITATQIAANAITATQLAANSVTAAAIQAGTITATQIATDTITSGQIAAGGITASELAANSVTAAAILANTITATQIAAGTITATQIAAGTITATQLAANSVTAAAILANTITATQIAANTITASQIAVGTITAAQIAAGTITASKLSITVGGGNLLSNSSFENSVSYLTGWTLVGSVTPAISTTYKYSGTQSLQLTASASGDYYYAQTVTGLLPSTTYTYSAWRYLAAAPTAGATSNRSIFINGASVTASTTTLSAASTTGVWIREFVSITTSATDTQLTCRLYCPNGTVYWDGVQLEQGDTVTAYAPLTSEILPGTVVANMIAANTITATQIAANTVTASQIAANTITASQIAAGTITATQIAAGTITGTNIAATGTITGAMIAAATIVAANIVSGTITGTQIAANTITATQIAAGTITATQIAASTITASKLSITVGGGNLLTNSNFANSTTGYVSYSGTLTIDGTTYFYPSQSLKVTSTGAANPGIQTNTITTLNANTTYTFSVWVKIPASGGISFVGLSVNGGGITTAIYNPTGGYTTTTGSWIRLYLTFTTNSTPASGITLYVQTNTTPTSGLYYNMGALQLEAGDTPTSYAPKGDEILPGTIVAGMIAANTITASQIAASTITSTQIAAATITGSNIAAGTIAAGNIQAATITGSLIAGTTITASNIVSGTITGTQIAALTITAANIVANTITATQIATGTITAAQIAAGTITANKLLITVGGGNLLPNSSFEGNTAWTQYGNAGWSYSTTTAVRQGTRSAKIAPTATVSGGTTAVGITTAGYYIPLALGATSVVFSMYAIRGAGTSLFYGQIDFRAADGSSVNPSGTVNMSGATTTAWTRFTSSVLSVPAGATNIYMDFFYYANYTNTDVMYIDDVQLEIGDTVTAYAPLTSEILPGTIVASMISSNTITATQIAASTITTTQIAAATILGANIAAGTIVAGNIQAATITGSLIAATTITASNIVTGTITAAQIAANTITATQIAANTITAGQIAAGTITTNQIAANTITGNNLATNTVTTNNLTVATFGASLAPNGSFEEATTNATLDTSGVAGWRFVNWPGSASSSTVTYSTNSSSAPSGTDFVSINLAAGANGAVIGVSTPIPTSNPDIWFVSFRVNATTAVAGLVQVIASLGDTAAEALSLSHTVNGTNIAGTLAEPMNGLVTGTSVLDVQTGWLTYEVAFTVPNNASGNQYRFLALHVGIPLVGTVVANTVNFDNVSLRPVGGSATITQLTASKITAGTLGADVVIGARLKTADTGARVEINADGLQTFDVNNFQTVSISSADGSGSFQGISASPASIGNAQILNSTLQGTDIIIDALGGQLFLYEPTGQTVTVFTSSTTWTCPIGVTNIKIECWGAGGGGQGSGSTGSSGGKAGGGGEYAREDSVVVTHGTVYTVTVGVGGTGGGSGTPVGANGSAGGNSSFVADNITCLAHGGKGGKNGANGAAGSGSADAIHFIGGLSGGTASTASGYGGASSAGFSANGHGGIIGVTGANNPGGAGGIPVSGGGAGGAGGTSGASGSGGTSGSNGVAPGGAGGGAGTYLNTGGSGARGQVTITYNAAGTPLVGSISAVAGVDGYNNTFPAGIALTKAASGYTQDWLLIGASGQPAFLNSWVATTAANDTKPGYYKDALGFVHLQGIITGGIASTTNAMFTLPVGFRPSGWILFSGGAAIGSTVASAQLRVDKVGNVYLWYATSGYVSSSYVGLNSICFLAEN